VGRLNESRIGAVINERFGVRASTALAETTHAAHGVTVLVGLDSDVAVSEPGGRRVLGRVIVVPADVPHAASCPGAHLGLLYDPEGAPEVATLARQEGAAFALAGGPGALLAGAVTAHRADLTRPDVLAGLAAEAAGRLGHQVPIWQPDRRVARLLELLREPAPIGPVPTLGLSAAHLQALFARDVGIPIRTYRLWRRLLTALAAFSRIDATRAAHLAGFADLAHFSRTCRRMLGSSPTALGRGLLPGRPRPHPTGAGGHGAI
jgi:AraC-like DNA-binding protein